MDVSPVPEEDEMMNTSFVRRFFAIAVLLLLAGKAHALESVVAKVIMVEPSYMPTAIMFKLDKSLPSCPAGSYVKWEKTADNNKAVFASLLTALATGRRIVFYIADGDVLCRGLFLHVLDS